MSHETETPTNRLAGESSPYLLQHARNPVGWFPWGDEAFDKARREDKPIFLSVGYATCHWCHVMERESFENPEIAALLNQRYVPIKVDREERPDVDNVYMQAVMAMTGRGGWPMSVFLTPEGKPFYGGTYFPPHDRHGMPGFATVLGHLSEAWQQRRQDVLASSEKLSAALQPRPTADGSELGLSALSESVAAFKAGFDPGHGGFGQAPKFPRSHSLSFLLGQWRRDPSNPDILGIVETTLDAMHAGGDYDHLGGGFHRYSTDRDWLVPHFEKMLYDQALLGITYLEAFQVTGHERHQAVTRDILRYVLRDMRDPAGGFYCAEDADSEGEEGKFYVWTQEEISAVLGREAGEEFCKAYGASPHGNFQEEATGHAVAANILHLPQPLADPDGFAAQREQLFAVRELRIHPLKDDKVLTDWNGLMISCLARAGRVLDEPLYTDAARAAANFILEHMQTDGRLLHRWRQGQAGILGYLDDYACFGQGLFDLYQATFEARWLKESLWLAREMIRLFADPERDGFFQAATDGEELIARTKDIYDGAQPSGSSVAALWLLKLARLTGDAQLEEAGVGTLRAFSSQLAHGSMHFPYAHMALDFLLGPTQELVLVGDPEDAELRAMARLAAQRFAPRMLTVFVPPGREGAELAELAPPLAGKKSIDNRATAHLCEGFTCQLPVTSAARLAELLES